MKPERNLIMLATNVTASSMKTTKKMKKMTRILQTYLMNSWFCKDMMLLFLLSSISLNSVFTASLPPNTKMWRHFVGYRNGSARRYIIDLNHCFELVFGQGKMGINLIIGRGGVMCKKYSRKRDHIFLWKKLNDLQKRYSSIIILHT